MTFELAHGAVQGMQSPARDPHRLIAAVGHQAGLEHVVPERDLPRGPFQAVGKLVVAERDVQALQQDLRLPGAAVVRQFQLRVDPARGKKIDPRLLERLGQGVHQPVVELQVAELGLQPLGTGLVEAGAAEGSDPQRRRAARGQQVVHGDPLVAHAERRAKVRQRMGQPAVVDVALDQPPAEARTATPAPRPGRSPSGSRAWPAPAANPAWPTAGKALRAGPRGSSGEMASPSTVPASDHGPPCGSIRPSMSIWWKYSLATVPRSCRTPGPHSAGGPVAGTLRVPSAPAGEAAWANGCSPVSPAPLPAKATSD